MYSMLLLALCTFFMVNGEQVFADGDNYCCRQYDAMPQAKRKCKRSANYDCVWLDRKDTSGDPSDRDIFQQYGAQCLGRKFVQCKRRKGLNYKCFAGCTGCPDPSCMFEPFEDLNPQCFIDQDQDQDQVDIVTPILADLNNTPSTATTSSLDIKLFAVIGVILFIFGACFVYYKRRNNNTKIQYSPVDNYGTAQNVI